MKPIKTLLVVTSIFPPDVGGPAKFCSDFSEWTLEKGVMVTVLTTANQDSSETANGRKIIRIGRNVPIVVRILKTFKNLFSNRKSQAMLVNGLFYEVFLFYLFSRRNYVVKIPSDIVWDRARNKKKTTLDVDSFQGHEKGVFRLQRIFFSLSLQSAKCVIVPSAHLGNLAGQWGVDPKRIALVRNSSSIARTPKNASTFSFDVVTVGRLIPLKGIAEIIDMCARLHLSLAILGDGPLDKTLRERANTSGANVHFLGAVSTTRVLETLELSRFFVLNSEHEGSPNALIEAMSLGSACIVRENAGTREIIRDLDTVIQVNRDRSLEEAIKLGLSDAVLYNKIRQNAYRYASLNFDRNENFMKILKVLELT